MDDAEGNNNINNNNNNNNHNNTAAANAKSYTKVMRQFVAKMSTSSQSATKLEDESNHKGEENNAGGGVNSLMGGKCCMKLPKKCSFSVLNEMRRKTKAQEDAELEAAKILERKEDREIRKALTDSTQYRFIQLSNGIRVLLASNKNIVCSAAALDVRIGAFSDPVNLQGLAHLLEHVLFTGSEAFPNESFSKFLGERGGSSNAFTASEHTNFHFDVPSLYFEAALARFVSFFQRPLFREISVQSELEIVQSEHEKNRFNDVWRTNQVERATANEKHPFSRFSTGSRMTLDLNGSPDRNLKYELFSFWKLNYSANLMSVCLIHKDDLESMEQLAKQYFIHLENKNIPETIWPSRTVFRSSQMRCKIYVLPIKDIYHVNLTFPMEDLSLFYAAGPQGYLAQILGHKGPGGLFSQLKGRGLAHNLIAGWKNLARGFSFFVITVHLTEMGERHIDEVVKLVFQFINLIKEKGPQKWFFDELRLLSERHFEHRERDREQTQASNVANWMHLYPPKDILSGEFLFSEWRPDLVKRVLKFLSPDNIRVTVLSKKCSFFVSQTEPNFGTEYHVEKIPEKVLEMWRNCGKGDDFRIPTSNELIPTSLEVNIPQDEERKRNQQPELFLMLDRIRMRAWHLRPPQNHFRTSPKAYLHFRFAYPDLATRDAATAALNILFVFLVRDSLIDYAYKAELAGILYTLRPVRAGIELIIRGFSQKQKLFLEKVTDAFYSTKVLNSDRFNDVFQVHKKGLESAETDSLKFQAKHLLNGVLCPKTFSKSERSMAMNEINFDKVKRFADEFRVKCDVECFFYGNVDLKSASEMTSLLIAKRKAYLERVVEVKKINVALPSHAKHLEEWFLKDPVERIVMIEDAFNKSSSSLVADNPRETAKVRFNQDLELPLSGSSRILLIPNEVQSSSCVLNFFQYRCDVPEYSATIELFLHVTRSRLISVLRDVCVLGYVVHVDIRRCNGTLGFRMTVESQYPLTVVFEAMEKAIQDLQEFLSSLDDATFNFAKTALISAKCGSMNERMRDTAGLLWKEITDSTYRFRRNAEEILVLEKLTQRDMIEFYEDRIKSGGKNRRNLVLSIGPDAILNRLEEDAETAVEQIDFRDCDEKLRSICRPFPILKEEDLNDWFKIAFSSRDADAFNAPEIRPEEGANHEEDQVTVH